MQIIVGKYAGFCYGVSRAIATIEKNSGKRLCTYGAIINNKQVTQGFAARGVRIIENTDDAEQSETVIIRSHGVAPEIYTQLEARSIEYIDATCSDVKKIHGIVKEARKAGHTVIVIGNQLHPEIVGIIGYADENVVVLQGIDDAAAFEPISGHSYSLVVQTTFDNEK